MPRGSHRTGEIAVGQVRRQHRLGTTATYRVAEIDGDHVVLEVWDVPGLMVGQTVRVTSQAARAMEVVASGEKRSVRVDAA